MNKFRIILALCLVLTIVASPVIAAEQAPAMPHIFFGAVYAGDQAAPGGVIVEAMGIGVHNGTTGNPVSTKADGSYGGPGSYDQKLIVQGEISNGIQISFYVNGGKAQCRVSGTTGAWQDSYPFKSAEKTNLDLLVATLPTGTTTIPPTAETTITTIATTATTPTYTSTSYSSSGGSGGGGGSYSGSFASGSTSAIETTRITATPTSAQTVGGNVGNTRISEITPVTQVTITKSSLMQPEVVNPETPPTSVILSSSPLPTIIGVVVIVGVIAAIVVIVVLRRKGHM
jgi:hypothetical protein